MLRMLDVSTNSNTLFYAGEPVPPGIYRRVDLDHEVILDQAGYLPASLDGRLAAYRSVESYWLNPLRRTVD